MRHRKVGKKFGREHAARKALLRGLVTSFIVSEKMQTTAAKAKAVRPIAERLVSRGRENTVLTRRYLMRYLNTEVAVLKVLNDLGPRYKSRNGGYTRITKLGTRPGDGAPKAQIEFV